MRLLQYPAAFLPVFYELGSYMGIPVVLGLVLFVVNLVRTMRGRPDAPATQAAQPGPRSRFVSMPHVHAPGGLKGSASSGPLRRERPSSKKETPRTSSISFSSDA